MEKREYAAAAVFYLAMALFIFRKLLLDGGVWNYGDSSFPVDDGSMDYLAESLKAVWWNRSFMGYDTTFQTIHSASFILAWKGLSLVFDYSTVQFVWYVVVFFVSAFSMYRLTRFLFASPLIAFASGLFYALNPWAIERLIVFPIYQAYAFIPALLLMYCLFMRRGEFKYTMAFALCAFFIIVSLHYTFYAVLLVGSYSLHHLIIKKKTTDLKRYLAENVKLVSLTMALLAFYALPLFYSIALKGGGTAAEALKRFSTEHVSAYFYGKDLTVANALRLLGFHDTFYSDQPAWFTLLSFVLPVLLVLPLVAKAVAKTKTLYFFYFWAIAGVLLSASTKLMSEATYRATLLKFPVLKTLASLPDPYYHTFLVSFAYGPILGTALFLIVKNLEKRFKELPWFTIIKPGFTVMFIVFAAAISYPALSWKDLRHTQFEYPREYFAAARFLQENAANTRVLVWPPAHSVKHDWAPYFICNFDKFVFNVDAFGTGIAEATPRGSLEFMNSLKASVADKTAFLNMLRLANVKYVVFMKDTEDAPPYVYSDPDMNSAFLKTVSDSSKFRLVKNFGRIAVYSVDEKYVLPLFYSPDGLHPTEQSLERTAALLEDIGRLAFVGADREVGAYGRENGAQNRFSSASDDKRPYSFYTEKDGYHEISAVFRLKKMAIPVYDALNYEHRPADIVSLKTADSRHAYFFSKGFSGPKELGYPLSKGMWRESSGRGEVVIFSPHKGQSKGDLLIHAACLEKDCAIEVMVNSQASWKIDLKPEDTRFRISGVALNPGPNNIVFRFKNNGKAEERFVIGEDIEVVAKGSGTGASPVVRFLKYSQNEIAYSVVSKMIEPADLNESPMFSLDYTWAANARETHVGFRIDSDNDGRQDIYFARELERAEEGRYQTDLYSEVVRGFAEELRGTPRLIGVDFFTGAVSSSVMPAVSLPSENIKRMRLGSKSSFIEKEGSVLETFRAENARIVATNSRLLSVYPHGDRESEITMPLDVRRLEGADFLKLSFSAPHGRIDPVRAWGGYDMNGDGVSDRFEPLGRRHPIREWTLKDASKGTYEAEAPSDLQHAWLKYNLILMKDNKAAHESPAINGRMVEANLGIWETLRGYDLWYMPPSDMKFEGGVAELLIETKDPLRSGTLAEVRFTMASENVPDAFEFHAPEYIRTYAPEKIAEADVPFIKIDGQPVAFDYKRLSGLDDTMTMKTRRFFRKGAHKVEFTGRGLYSDGFIEVRPALDIAKPDKRQMPDIAFVRESSVRYVVKIKNAESPFVLVFSQSYDDKWKAAAVESGDGSQPAKVNEHLMVNGYANGWKVEPDKDVRDFTIVVEYEPQRVYVVGIILSLSALSGSVLYMAGMTFWKGRRKDE